MITLVPSTRSKRGADDDDDDRREECKSNQMTGQWLSRDSLYPFRTSIFIPPHTPVFSLQVCTFFFLSFREQRKGKQLNEGIMRIYSCLINVPRGSL